MKRKIKLLYAILILLLAPACTQMNIILTPQESMQQEYGYLLCDVEYWNETDDTIIVECLYSTSVIRKEDHVMTKYDSGERIPWQGGIPYIVCSEQVFAPGEMRTDELSFFGYGERVDGINGPYLSPGKYVVDMKIHYHKNGNVDWETAMGSCVFEIQPASKKVRNVMKELQRQYNENDYGDSTERIADIKSYILDEEIPDAVVRRVLVSYDLRPEIRKAYDDETIHEMICSTMQRSYNMNTKYIRSFLIDKAKNRGLLASKVLQSMESMEMEEGKKKNTEREFRGVLRQIEIDKERRNRMKQE